MRTKEVKILEKTYLMTFNNSVLVYMEQNGIKLQELTENDAPVSVMIEMLSRMITSGARYSKKIGGPEYPEITADDLAESTDVGELQDLMTEATYCITGQRNVDAVPKKKEPAVEKGQKN